MLPLAVGLVLILGCGGGDPLVAGPPPPPPPPPPANSVNVTSNQFSPKDLNVARNATVTWSFQGGVHNVTFEDGQGSSNNQSAGTHTRQFGNAGTFRYRCTNHSTDFANGMIGQVAVAN